MSNSQCANKGWNISIKLTHSLTLIKFKLIIFSFNLKNLSQNIALCKVIILNALSFTIKPNYLMYYRHFSTLIFMIICQRSCVGLQQQQVECQLPQTEITKFHVIFVVFFFLDKKYRWCQFQSISHGYPIILIAESGQIKKYCWPIIGAPNYPLSLLPLLSRLVKHLQLLFNEIVIFVSQSESVKLSTL